MKILPVVPIWAKVALCVVALVLMTPVARAENMRTQILLVWGTDDAKSPDPKHRPVDPDLAKRLRKLPYRWKNYFLVNQQEVQVADGETKTKITVSPRCILDIRNLGANRIEVRLHGDGKPVSVHREALPIRGLLILSGDAGNETGWLVIIRRVEGR